MDNALVVLLDVETGVVERPHRRVSPRVNEHQRVSKAHKSPSHYRTFGGQALRSTLVTSKLAVYLSKILGLSDPGDLPTLRHQIQLRLIEWTKSKGRIPSDNLQTQVNGVSYTSLLHCSLVDDSILNVVDADSCSKPSWGWERATDYLPGASADV